MPVSFENYQKNKFEMAEELKSLYSMLGQELGDDVEQQLSADSLQKLNKLKRALEYINNDIEKQKTDPSYRTDEQLMQPHLNELAYLSQTLKMDAGGKTLQDVITPTAEQAARYNGILRTFDKNLGTELFPKEVGANYREQLENANALKNIDVLKKRMERPSFHNMNEMEKRDFVAAILASRMTVNTKGGRASYLDKEMDPEEFKKNYQALLGNENFRKFVEKLSTYRIEEKMAGGHGGDLEKLYKRFTVRQMDVPEGVPERYAPTALAKIDYLKTSLEKKDLSLQIKQQLVTDILASRIAVNARKGQKSSLDKPMTAESFKAARDKLMNNETYKKLLDDPQKFEELTKATLKGHGGKAEEYIQKHTATAEPINNDNPAWLSPNVPTPKTFAEAQASLASGVGKNNPKVMERQLATAFYLANAEKNPNLDASKNIEARITQVQESEPFRYMMEKQGPEQMANAVQSGPVTTSQQYGYAAEILTHKKNVADLEEAKKLMQEGPKQEGEVPAGPGFN